MCTASYPIHKHLLRRGAGATSVAACSTCLEGTYSNGTGAYMYLWCMKFFVLWILTWSWTQTLLGLDGWFSHTVCTHIIDQNSIVFFKLVNESLFASSSMLHPPPYVYRCGDLGCTADCLKTQGVSHRRFRASRVRLGRIGLDKVKDRDECATLIGPFVIVNLAFEYCTERSAAYFHHIALKSGSSVSLLLPSA